MLCRLVTFPSQSKLICNLLSFTDRAGLITATFSPGDDKEWCGDNAKFQGPSAMPYLRKCFCSSGYEGDGFHCEGSVTTFSVKVAGWEWVRKSSSSSSSSSSSPL